MTNPAITVTSLTKRYPKAKADALKGLNICIQKQDFFGLLGPNGSGKTTLISIIAGLLSKTSGNIKVNRDLIGLVPQQIALYPTLTLHENLVLFGKLYHLTKNTIKERIEYCLTITELTKSAYQPIHQFSGGMQRRANLAIGLIQNPEILLLDEPTANVDPHARNLIFESLKRMNQEGMTILYTTHYLEEVEKLCSQIAILDQGEIIAYGSLENLLENHKNSENLADLFLNLTGKNLRD